MSVWCVVAQARAPFLAITWDSWRKNLSESVGVCKTFVGGINGDQLVAKMPGDRTSGVRYRPSLR